MSDLHGVTIDTIFFFKKRNFWIYAELQLTSMFEQAHKIYVVKTLDLQKVTLWCPVFFHKHGINSWFITKRCFEITDIGIDHSSRTSPSLCPSKWSCVPILTPQKNPQSIPEKWEKVSLVAVQCDFYHKMKLVPSGNAKLMRMGWNCQVRMGRYSCHLSF